MNKEQLRKLLPSKGLTQALYEAIMACPGRTAEAKLQAYYDKTKSADDVSLQFLIWCLDSDPVRESALWRTLMSEFREAHPVEIFGLSKLANNFIRDRHPNIIKVLKEYGIIT